MEGLFGLEADEAVDELAVFEEEHGGDGADLVLLGGAGVGVDVELGDDIAAVGLGGELFDDGGDGATRPAPVGPTVDEDGLSWGGSDDGVELGVGQFDGPAAGRGGSGKRSAALAAGRLEGGGFEFVDAVFGVAIWAGYYGHLSSPFDRRIMNNNRLAGWYWFRGVGMRFVGIGWERWSRDDLSLGQLTRDERVPIAGWSVVGVQEEQWRR